MLIETTIKTMIKEAVKTNNIIVKDVLRVVLGSIQLESSSKDLTEDQKLNIIRKLIKSNETTLESMDQKPTNEWSQEWQENAPKLRLEIATLQTLLPKTLNEKEVIALLTMNIISDIKAAKSDGQSLGIAMKYFKSISAPIDNFVVKKVVEELRR